jgi:hypothetical protein
MFFGGEGDSFCEIVDCFRGRIPDDLLPISWAAQGDAICYLLSGEKAGNIWYREHENESSEAYEDRSNCYLCSDSFDDFVNGFFNYFDEHKEDGE